MKKYLVKSNSKEVVEVEIEKERNSCIWVEGKRISKYKNGKYSGHDIYYKSYEDAISSIRWVLHDQITNAQDALEMYENELKAFDKKYPKKKKTKFKL